MAETNNTLRLGIVMAGAVSAGAYQGGVIDYFFQIMDAWEAEKKARTAGIPTHEVRLDILSGASAGGMTAGMMVAALQQDHQPVTPDKRNDEAYKKGNVLYNAWVNLTDDEMMPVLLSTADIAREGKVISALNADFIKQIAEREIQPEKCPKKELPPYVHPNMEVLLTLTNLAGFQYHLFFTGAHESYHAMGQYRDFASFSLGTKYKDDGRIPLNINAGTGDAELRQAAPATGAFPVGFAYREFVRRKKYVYDNEDLLFVKRKTESPDPRDIAANPDEFKLMDFDGYTPANGDEPFVTYHVDGGMINNQPFDVTMKIMNKLGAKTEKTAEEDFDSTIIMIDPFPAVESVMSRGKVIPQKAPAGKLAKGDFPFSFMNVIGKVFGAMRGQLLFKGPDIVAAFSDENFSRFLISPSGKKNNKPYEGSKAIACGCMDGFSGFIDKSFRVHDFYLGRQNAQNFFKWHFVVKLGADMKPVNPVIAEGYTAAAVEKFKFQYDQEKKDMGAAKAPWYVPIIPDLFYDGTPKTEEQVPPFPQYNMADFDKYRSAIIKRINVVGSNLLSGGYKVAFKIVFFFAKGSIYKHLKNVVQSALEDWKIVKKTAN